MKQENIGKFIAKLRKEKDLTQEELGEKIGVSGKSISKWECGINVPDFSNIEALSTFFDVSIFEIFNGERIDNEKAKNNFNKNSNNYFIEYFKKLKIKNRNIIIFFIALIFLLLSVFTFFFFVNNFNKNRVYTISSNSDGYSVDGYLIFNQEQNLIIINDIISQDNIVGTIDDPIVTNAKVNFFIDDVSLISYDIDDSIIYKSDINSLSVVLSNVSFSALENKQNNNNNIVNKDKLKNAYLLIEYENNESKNNQIKINLNLDKTFSNNKIVY